LSILEDQITFYVQLMQKTNQFQKVEGSELLQAVIWAVMESGFHLVKKFSTVPKPNIWNTTCSEFWVWIYCIFGVAKFWKKYILYKIRI